MYYFGFLPQKLSFEFDRVRIRPISRFDQASAWIKRYRHEDRFLYPSAQGKRAALLHKVPASHALELGKASSRDPRRLEAMFVIHLLGYLHGTWLQFSDWWFDGRVPINHPHGFKITTAHATEFLSHALRTWRTWGTVNRRRFTNILFMLNRAPSYEWDWERFLIEYMVLDGCFSVANGLIPFQKKGLPPHGKRVGLLCKRFRLARSARLVKRLVRLRNDLFHETLWDKGQPTTARSVLSAYAPYNLHRLNQRLVPALLNYQNSYVRSRWWAMGNLTFAPP